MMIHEPIFKNNRQIGDIFLLKDEKLKSVWEIQYNIHPDYWGQGIMSKELPKFLKLHGDKNIGAFVKNNIVSEKLLTNNGFVEFPFKAKSSAKFYLKTKEKLWNP